MKPQALVFVHCSCFLDLAEFLPKQATIVVVFTLLKTRLLMFVQDRHLSAMVVTTGSRYGIQPVREP